MPLTEVLTITPNEVKLPGTTVKVDENNVFDVKDCQIVKYVSTGKYAPVEIDKTLLGDQKLDHVEKLDGGRIVAISSEEIDSIIIFPPSLAICMGNKYYSKY